jgi:hypothetical protein
MQLSVGEILSRVTTVSDMIRTFQDEDHCRRLLEAMVWPNGRICPACGYRRSIALMGRENGKRARPGLYQCSSGTCRYQFTGLRRKSGVGTRKELVFLTCSCGEQVKLLSE